MKNRWMRAVGMMAIHCGVALSLAACGIASAPPSEAAKLAPAAAAAESAPKAEAQASLCSAVDESTRHGRGACHHHAPAGHHGMCQPQSIPYARCRSHISSCGLGNTSPVQLFNCEQQRGYTSPIPEAGSLMAIGVNSVHHMSTGHTLYVEEVCPKPDGTYRLRVSHTNYDRQCHLEEDAWVHYDPRTLHADFATGHWAAWGKHLPVQGFILQAPAKGDMAAPAPAVAAAEPHKPKSKTQSKRKAATAKHKPAKKPARK